MTREDILLGIEGDPSGLLRSISEIRAKLAAEIERLRADAEAKGIEVPVEVQAALSRLEKLSASITRLDVAARKPRSMRLDTSEAEGEAEDLEDAIEETAEALDDMAAAGDSAAARLAGSLGRGRRSLSALAGEVGRLQRLLRLAAQQPSFDPASEEAQRLVQSVRAVQAEFRDAMQAAQANGRAATAEMRRLAGVTDQVDDAAGRAAREMRRLDDAVDDLDARGLREVEGGLGKIQAQLKQVAGTLLAAFSADRLIDFTRESVAAARQLKGFEDRLRTASGSSAAAQRELSFLVDTSDRLALSFNPLLDGYSRLAAAVRTNEKLSAAQREIFLGAAEAARANRLSNEDLNGVLLAFGQIASKGRVQAEELRGQIGERLPGAFELAAKAMGVTTGELNKMLERGQVAAEDLLPKLGTALREEFGSAARSAADDADGLAVRIENAGVRFQQAFGAGILAGISGQLGEAADELDRLGESGSQAGQLVGAGLGSLIERVDGVVSVLAALAALVSNDLPAGTVSARAEFERFGAGVTTAFQNIPILGGLIEERIRGIAQAGQEAQARLVPLADQLQAALAAGDSVEAARTLEVLAEVVRIAEDAGGVTAETGSRLLGLFDQARQGLKELPDGFEDLAAAVQDQLGGAFEGVVARVQELADRASSGGQVSAEAIAELGTELTQVRSLLGDLPPGADLLRDALRAAAVSGVEAFDQIRESGRDVPPALREIQDALRGIVAASREAAEVDRSREGILARMAEQIERNAELDRKRADELRGTAEEVAELTDQTLALIAVLEDENTELGLNQEQFELVQGQIQKALDAAETYGAGVPAALQEAADAYGVLSSTAEKSLKEQIKLAEEAAEREKKAAEERVRALDSIGDAAARLTSQLRQERPGADGQEREIAALEEQIQGLRSQPALSPEQLAELTAAEDQLRRVRAEARRATREWAEGNNEVVATSQQVDDAIADLLSSIEDDIATLSAAQRDAVFNSLGALQQLGELGTASGENIAGVMERVSDVLSQAGVDTGDLRREIDGLRGGGLDLRREFAEIERRIRETGEAGESFGEGIADGAETAEEALDRQAETLREHAEAVARIGTDLSKGLEGAHPAIRRTIELTRELLAACVELKESGCCGHGRGGPTQIEGRVSIPDDDILIFEDENRPGKPGRTPGGAVGGGAQAPGSGPSSTSAPAVSPLGAGSQGLGAASAGAVGGPLVPRGPLIRDFRPPGTTASGPGSQDRGDGPLSVAFQPGRQAPTAAGGVVATGAPASPARGTGAGGGGQGRGSDVLFGAGGRRTASRDFVEAFCSRTTVQIPRPGNVNAIRDQDLVEVSAWDCQDVLGQGAIFLDESPAGGAPGRGGASSGGGGSPGTGAPRRNPFLTGNRTTFHTSGPEFTTPAGARPGALGGAAGAATSGPPQPPPPTAADIGAATAKALQPAVRDLSRATQGLTRGFRRLEQASQRRDTALQRQIRDTAGAARRIANDPLRDIS